MIFFCEQIPPKLNSLKQPSYWTLGTGEPGHSLIGLLVWLPRDVSWDIQQEWVVDTGIWLGAQPGCQESDSPRLLQHRCFRVLRLLAQRLAESRAHVLGGPGRSLMIFYDLALEVFEYHFCHTPLVKIKLSRFAWSRDTLHLSMGRVAEDLWQFLK